MGFGYRYHGKKSFNFGLDSSYPEVDKITDKIWGELTIDKRVKVKAKKRYLKTALLNYKLSEMTRTKVSYSRDKNFYRLIDKRYKLSHRTYDIVTQIQDELERLGYSKDSPAYAPYSPGAKPRRTRTEPSVKLVQLLRSITPVMICETQKRETVILRDENKMDIAYQETPRTAQMREDLRLINAVRYNTGVALKGVPYELFDKYRTEIARLSSDDLDIDGKNKSGAINLRTSYLHRVFNRDFTHGGRFYGGVETALKRELRPFLRIYSNGSYKRTIELDYSALHVRMLYHKMGRDFRGDPYGILCGNDKRMRKFYKQMMLMAINAENEAKAIRAFRKKNSGYKRVFGSLTDRKIGNLIRDIRVGHPQLQHFLFRGKGSKLMFEDSWIADRVLLHFARQGVLCLCVHDSFIIEKRYGGELKEVMDFYYGLKLGFRANIE